MTGAIAYRKALPHGSSDEPPLSLEIAYGSIGTIDRERSSAWVELAAALARPASGEMLVAGQNTADLTPRELAALRVRHVSIVAPRLLAYDPNFRAERNIRAAPGSRGVAQEVVEALGIDHLLAERLKHWPSDRLPLISLLQAVGQEKAILALFDHAHYATAAGGDEKLDAALSALAARGRAVVVSR